MDVTATRPRRAVMLRIAGVAAVLVLAVTGTLWAHVTLLRSSPAKDSRQATPPTMVHLEFSEAAEPSTSRIELVSPDDERIALRPRRPANDSVRHLDADVPALSVAGRYRLEWRLIGADGHPVSGSYAFTVDSIPAAAQPDTLPTISPAEEVEEPAGTTMGAGTPVAVVVRFTGLLAMIIVTGSAALALIVLPRAGESPSGSRTIATASVHLRLAGWVRAAAGTLLTVAAVRLVMQSVALAGSASSVTPGDVSAVLAAGRWGTGWSLQLIGAVILLVGTRGGALAVAERPRRWRVIAVAAVLLAMGASAMGHPAAVPEAPLVAMGLDALHALGAGGWVGALLGMTLVVLPGAMSEPEESRADSVRRTLRAFSPVAIGGATTLALTGLIGGWWQLRGDLSALFGSAYGQLLLTKILAVAVVAALGAYHWKVVQPAVGDARSLSRLRRSTRTELSVMMLVLVLTAILTGTAP